MGLQIVLGAGAVGQATAQELAGAGHEVRIVSRSGRGPERAGIHPVAADVTDAGRLTAVSEGADSIVNALNPAQYWKWEQLWPPMAAAILTAAERSGAGLVTVSNLYLYGEVTAPMTEDSAIAPNGPKGALRAQMWRDALALHEAGRIRATELRASDYVGPGVGAQSFLNSYVIRPAISGRTPWLVMGRPDAPHTWTDVRDTGRLAATLATDDRAWGQAGHVPSAEPRTMAVVAEQAARLAGQAPRRPHGIPRGVLTSLGLVVPLMRELRETRHQFARAFVLDASVTERTFGLAATPWDQTLRETVDYLSGTAA